MMERAYDYDNIIIVVTFMKLKNYFIVHGNTLTFSGFRELCFLDTMSTNVLKTLSEA